MVKIHYFYDPMCGWCFGATSLMEAVNAHESIDLEMHPGGMIQRREMDPSFRQMVLSHDKKIEALTGQKFGQSYKDRVTSEQSVILDSYITAKAVAAAQSVSKAGFAMLKGIQTAHFQKGLDVSSLDTLKLIVTELKIDDSRWHEVMANKDTNITSLISESQALMQQWQVQGFPTLILETEKGLKRVPHTQFYNKLEDWDLALKALTES
ncbi:DsbA family protein [Vibrio algarum]|uniref:DsbA family protein n=1 Tax=Vibrio algarum TaxID=3020714 RepID=A0ABT4YTR5_9VIBR|nr:DsbA family protein [Vibrio sp. KJ40-1]MDB1124946.1 DsbA family protein [Vibrio sp. KJ40-1]